MFIMPFQEHVSLQKSRTITTLQENLSFSFERSSLAVPLRWKREMASAFAIGVMLKLTLFVSVELLAGRRQ